MIKKVQGRKAARSGFHPRARERTDEAPEGSFHPRARERSDEADDGETQPQVLIETEKPSH